MSEASEAVDELNSKLTTTESLLSSIQNKVQGISGNLRGSVGGVSGGGSQVANISSSTTGAQGAGGNAGGIYDLPTPDFKDPETRKARRALIGLTSGVEMATGLSAMLPTTQEAVQLDTLANRLRFYGNESALRNIGGAFKMQSDTAALGTPVNAMDVPSAANLGAGMGLLPGLSNYNAARDFGGIMGGAALASNLTPGLGFQGGMAAMAGLNTARNVNMLRMIGINVRNQQGQMNDLPDIIGGIFKLLEQSAGTGKVTAEAIAVSAMSGNALDSILNQYFGNDAALRQTVLSGLLQMANTGGASLSTSGTRDMAVTTGALSAPAKSLAERSVAEQRMLQKWTSATNVGLMGANSLLKLLYQGLENGNELLQNVQAGVIATETFSGARGGAGGVITDAILGLGGALPGGGLKGALGKLGLAGGLLAAGGTYATAKVTDGLVPNPNVSPGAPDSWGNTPLSKNPVYTGNNITINVTAPTGSDPWAFANQINQAMVDAARR